MKLSQAISKGVKAMCIEAKVPLTADIEVIMVQILLDTIAPEVKHAMKLKDEQLTTMRRQRDAALAALDKLRGKTQ